MTELELWKRIASNAHKVEGLQVSIDVSLVVANNAILTPNSRPADHRYAALLVVDAIEKAGLAQFERNRSEGSITWWVFVDDDYGKDFFAMTKDQEHISLLECIAYVLEGLE
jgi:hypothetical protein